MGKTLLGIYSGYLALIHRHSNDKDDQRVSGLSIELMNEIARIMGFKFWYRYGGYDLVVMGRQVGKVAMISKGEGHIGLPQAGFPEHLPMVDYSNYIFYDNGKFCTRQPVILDHKGTGVVRVLPVNAWLLVIFALLSVSIMSTMSYLTYNKLNHNDMMKKPVSYLDFLLLPFSTLTEPDPIPWFPKFSSGKATIALWSIFAFLMNMIYQSNLRAQLTYDVYEKPLDTLEDILTRGQRVYLPIDFPILFNIDKDLLKSDKDAQTWVKVLRLARKTGGFYSLLQNGGGLPGGTWEDVWETGASYLAHGILSVKVIDVHSRSKGDP